MGVNCVEADAGCGYGSPRPRVSAVGVRVVECERDTSNDGYSGNHKVPVEIWDVAGDHKYVPLCPCEWTFRVHMLTPMWQIRNVLACNHAGRGRRYSGVQS